MAVSDRPAVILLGFFAIVLTLSGLFWPVVIPPVVLLLPMFLASLWLGPRTLPWFVVFTTSCVALLIVTDPTSSPRTVARAAVTFLIAFLIMVTSFRRSTLGVSGPIGESMFVDLRDRISKQGNLPVLPSEWHVESEVRSAGGTAFAGDFIVANRTRNNALELVVVDVSGKGVEAGSRSLFLSGAFNGIASALPGQHFLPAANAYLMGQGWAEGFATAIHLHLDLLTGDFELRKAGHPPAVWLHAGSGRWEVLDSEGPVLGLIEDTHFECIYGHLARGDGLMLFTDGLVETARRDLNLGIDKLAGVGARLLQHGFEGGAHQVLDTMEQTNDDRALVVVHRRS
ncbi:MAG: PP2C family protein-serine/threonine phosphatase [Marmoricola sp.]